MAETIYILAGSNCGDRERNLQAALDRIEAIPGLEIVATSAVYISEAVEMEGEAPSFMNQVIKADYEFTPNELLSGLELIEKGLGRTGKGKKLPRSMDLDILLFGNQIIETERLSVPHRRLLERPFAMVPLLQIDPDLEHPVTKQPIADFLTEEGRETTLLYKDHVARSV